jgi:hypothetical protein
VVVVAPKVEFGFGVWGGVIIGGLEEVLGGGPGMGWRWCCLSHGRRAGPEGAELASEEEAKEEATDTEGRRRGGRRPTRKEDVEEGGGRREEGE